MFHFVVPVLACGWLHHQTTRGLSKLKQNQSQNANLSRVIIFSWAAWVILWSPDFLINTVISMQKQQSLVFLVLATLSFSLKGLYLQLNPILITATYRPIRDRVELMKNRLKKCLYNEASSTNPAGNLQPNNPKNMESKHLQKGDKKPEKQTIILGILFFIVLVPLLGFTTINQLSWGKIFSDIRSTAKVSQLGSRNFMKVRQNSMNTLNLHQTDPRLSCQSLEGSISWKFKRCLLLTSDSKQRNFAEQKSNCQQQGFTLAYPRNMQESHFITNFYKHSTQYFPACSPLKEPLPLGFDPRPYTFQLESVDGKFFILGDTYTAAASSELDDRKPADLHVPMDLIRVAYHQMKGYDLLCYPKQGSTFGICGKETKRYCHVCFQEI